jgi:hypothetical protein
MTRRWSVFCIAIALTLAAMGSAQTAQTYPHAVTDSLIHAKTPMPPPPANMPFTDPDFGALMVRATDETTNFKLPGTFLRTEASGQANMWSMDTGKFYVIGEGGRDFAFAFTPSTMAITSLPNAASGRGLLLPLRPEPTFSFVDPDLIYGTTNAAPLTISSYRFSTGALSTVIDTRTCQTHPPLVNSSTTLSDDDVSLSLDDSRVAISEGGPQSGKDIFVVVYDKSLGCRWYNTETGEIGGQWGPTGYAAASGYLIRHAYLSRNGGFVRILVDNFGFYVWDLTTLNVNACPIVSANDCAGYGVVGYDHYLNDAARIDHMQLVKRPLGNLNQITPLVWPLPPPHYWGQNVHFTWSNVDENDSIPACGSTYYYGDHGNITQPYEGEIFCFETDAIASIVWRFAHNRATNEDEYFNTQPLGSVSREGQFYLFTSDWDEQLGKENNGTPRSDVWIVKLDY